jgi:hypothetical protein
MASAPLSRLAAVIAGAVAAFVAVAVHAEAQGRPQWEFEIHGTFASASGVARGQSTAPPAGQPLVLGDGVTTSRVVPSWYFGDGANLLNQVLLLRGLTQRVTALDLSSWPAGGRRAGAQVGARIARQATRTVWVEVSFDLGLDPIGFDRDGLDRIEATRASFVTAFTALANSTSTLMPDPTVTSTATITPGGRRAVVTGAVQYRADRRGLAPFVMAGGGYAATVGAPTRLTLVGNYQFATPGLAVIDETDTMTLEYQGRGGFFWVTGFGMLQEWSTRSGFRTEVRVQVGSTDVAARLFTEPSSRVTSPTGAAILNGTTPGLQFSSTNLRTNLSGSAWEGFAAHRGSVRAIQWTVSAGYYLRF